MSYPATPRVDEAATAISRAPVALLAATARVPLATITAALAAALSTVRDDMCEIARTVEEIEAEHLDDVAENADFDCPGAYLPALRLASALRNDIRDARADECKCCGGTGEADIDHDDGYREFTYQVQCPCGGV